MAHIYHSACGTWACIEGKYLSIIEIKGFYFKGFEKDLGQTISGFFIILSRRFCKKEFLSFESPFQLLVGKILDDLLVFIKVRDGPIL